MMSESSTKDYRSDLVLTFAIIYFQSMIKLSEIISVIEAFAPPQLQESYDNAGLITGDPTMGINEAILCLDATEEVVDEAIETNCNLIIAHHPIVFSGLK